MTNDGLQKPDILAVQVSGDKVFLVDHTVVWEHADLAWHFDNKEQYYLHDGIVDKVKQLHPHVQVVEV